MSISLLLKKKKRSESESDAEGGALVTAYFRPSFFHEVEEKKVFDVRLNSPGQMNLAVVKVLYEEYGGTKTSRGSMSHKEAKELADAAPVVVREGLTLGEAMDLRDRLEGAGADVDIVYLVQKPQQPLVPYFFHPVNIQTY
jgi:ribosomal protein L7/L12